MVLSNVAKSTESSPNTVAVGIIAAVVIRSRPSRDSMCGSCFRATQALTSCSHASSNRGSASTHAFLTCSVNPAIAGMSGVYERVPPPAGIGAMFTELEVPAPIRKDNGASGADRWSRSLPTRSYGS